MRARRKGGCTSTAGTALAAAVFLAGWAPTVLAMKPEQLVQTICVACHNEHALQAGLNLQDFDPRNAHLQPVVAEKMIRKLRAGQMPPREIPRSGEEIMALVETLESSLDRAAREEKRVGTRPFPRVNRAEYARLVRDVLGLTVDPSEWLPQDQISGSFDNIADVQGMSPTLVYIIEFFRWRSDREEAKKYTK